MADLVGIAEAVGAGVDVVGVAVIVVGALVVTVVFAVRLRRDGGRLSGAYRLYRQDLGRAILLGLEFLVAGDIIRTVAASPTFTSVGVLALIVAVRTVLSFSLEVELEGAWPWQRRRTTRPPDTPEV
ncbi:DUF1622 domain-containing protein [Actinoallomurus acaciae]|uniref:DUF1622 domain-containing protein n=1 Tax=Actinoallomurus acaciae TaxID=502577 RepID=A0ABV5YUQ3_9ACTN